MGRGHSLGRPGRRERRPAGERLVEDRSEAEDVRPLVDVSKVSGGLFRRHIGRCADHGPRLRLVGAPCPVADVARPIDMRRPTVEDLGQAPVHHLDLAEGSDHDVGGLEVAVDHAPGVRVGHGVAGEDEDSEEPAPVVRGVGPLDKQLGQGPPLDQFHGDVGPVAFEQAELVDRHDARMLELASDPRLGQEPSAQGRVAFAALAEQLDRHVPAEPIVPPPVNGPHAPPADLDDQADARGRLVPAVRDGRVPGKRAGSRDRLDIRVVRIDLRRQSHPQETDRTETVGRFFGPIGTTDQTVIHRLALLP